MGAADTYTVDMQESPFSPAGTIAFSGSMKKLEIADAQVLATVTVTDGGGTWPALTSKDYGRGATLLVPFDLADVAPQDKEAAKAILTEALELLPAPGYLPDVGAPVPVAINLENLGVSCTARAELTLPAGLTFLWAGGGTLDGDKVVWELDLAEGEERELNLLARPDHLGSYTLAAELFWLQASEWVPHRSASLPFAVQRDAALLKSDLTTALSALLVDKSERAHRDNAIRRVGKVDPAETDPTEIDKQIKELLKAADHLMRIGSVDTDACRLLLSRLLAQIQMRWYAACGGDGS